MSNIWGAVHIFLDSIAYYLKIIERFLKLNIYKLFKLGRLSVRIFRIVVLLMSIFIVAACDIENGDESPNGDNDTIPGDTDNGEDDTDNGEDDPSGVITLTFIGYNDDIVEEVRYEENTDIMFPQAPEREGYYFVEWDIPYEEIDFTEDVVVEPIYEINVYTVTVKGPEETTIMSLDREHGASIDLDDPEPIESYRFVEYQDVPSEVTEDIVIHAIYEEIPEVTLNFYDDTSIIIETVSGYLDDGLDMPQAPDNDGYTFEGWALQSNGEPIDVRALDEGEHDLYAIYEAKETTVYFDFNEGSEPIETSIPYNQWIEVDEVINIPNRDNYEFSYWEDVKDGSIYEEWIRADDLESFTLIAHWDGVTDEWLFDVEEGEATLTEYLKEDTDIVIPDMIGGKPVTTIGPELFDNVAYDDLEVDSVVVGENVHTIEASAFDRQRDIETFTFENPDGIKHVKERAFAHVEVDNFEFPSQLLTIEEYAFHSSNISEVTFNNDVEYIGDKAFTFTPIIGTIEFPDSLIEIGESAFRETLIETVIFNDGLKVIDDGAFDSTNELSEVSIPSSVEIFGDGVFRDSESLETVIFEDNSQVSEIGNQAFEGTLNLHTIILPENLEVIGREAFRKNASLETIDIPNSVHTIQFEAFRQMSALKHITIPEGISELPQAIFWQSENLETVDLPNSLETIGPQAFKEVKTIQTIDIPEGVTEIGASAFSRAEQLENIELPDGLETIAGALFFNTASLTEITIPEGITDIGGRAFQGSNIHYVDIPDTIQTIHIGAFKSTTNLQPLVLPDSLEKISAEAFQSSGLDWVFIPESVTSIENNAFSIYYSDFTIYLERSSDHPDWYYNWNPSNNPIEYNSEPPE